MDGEDEYRVCILRKGSQNFDYSSVRISVKQEEILDFAESPAHRDRTGIPILPACPCPARGVDPQESRESKHPVSTSQKVRFMVREYTQTVR